MSFLGLRLVLAAKELQVSALSFQKGPVMLTGVAVETYKASMRLSGYRVQALFKAQSLQA